MKSLRLPSNLIALVVLLAAIGFLSWISLVRTERVNFITGLAQSAPLTQDSASPTGYAGGIRPLIAPEHNNDSYQWIAQTQLMLNQHEWRLRHVNYDNAPDGRAVRSTSPYRWWLALVSWTQRDSIAGSSAVAVEKAALLADPVLQILLLILTTAFTAWCFGGFSASLVCLGFATLFPFVTAFLPGQPSDYGLSLIAALWSILPLLASLLPRVAKLDDATSLRLARRWFFVAGIAGGFGLWISVVHQLPILFGIGCGALLSCILARRNPMANAAPWRAWALGGACASLVAFLIEYSPETLALKEWHLEIIHPLHAVAWLALGEILTRIDDGVRRGKPAWNRQSLAIVLTAVVTLAAIPAVIIFKGNQAWLSADTLASRLTNLPAGPVATNLFAWLAHDHLGAMAFATAIPLLFLGFAVWLITRKSTTANHRLALSVAAGPVLIALALGCFQIRWWHFVDVTLLSVIVAVSTTLPASRSRWLWSGLSILIFAFGIFQILPSRGSASADTVTETEVVSLVERDLAHWLANRAGPDGAVVLAPPSLTTSLFYHGGLRGLGTPYADNREGFNAAARLAGTTSSDEAQALIRKRGITHIIIPSWDSFLDDYARASSTDLEHTLVGLLHQWLPPRWLRAVPYHLPQIAGFEGQSVAIFEITELQDNVTALSGLAEYFAEMEMLDQAAAIRHALSQSFPNEIGSLVAQAQVSIALRDGVAFNRILTALVPRLAEDEVQGLAWDRRVSLAIVLAEGKQKDASREQVERCLAELDEPLMRSLSPVALYRLQVLAKAFGLEITEPTLRELARNLLSPEMRSAL